MKRFLFGALAAPAFSMLYAGNALAAVRAADLIPAQMALPAPWGLIKAFLLLTFFIHIVLVDIVIGSSMLASINAWKSRPYTGYNLKKDTGFATGTLALAVNFGVAPFLFAQVAYGSFLYTSSLLMAAWWLAIPLLVILAYYALYIIKAAEPDGVFKRRLVIGANTLLLMLVAFLLSTNSNMLVNPESWPAWLERPGGGLLQLDYLSFYPRYLHILAAALAVGGLFMAVRARWGLRRPGADPAEAEARARYGLTFFIYASLAQALAGVWYLFSQPAPVRDLFLGGSVFATGALVLAVLGLGAALWTARSGLVALTAGFTLGVIFIMVCVRDLVRGALLSPYNLEQMRSAAGEVLQEAGPEGVEFFPHLVRQAVEQPLPVHAYQFLAVGLFLACTAVGIAAIFWLARVAMRTFNGAAESRGE